MAVDTLEQFLERNGSAIVYTNGKLVCSEKSDIHNDTLFTVPVFFVKLANSDVEMIIEKTDDKTGEDSYDLTTCNRSRFAEICSLVEAGKPIIQDETKIDEFGNTMTAHFYTSELDLYTVPIPIVRHLISLGFELDPLTEFEIIEQPHH